MRRRGIMGAIAALASAGPMAQAQPRGASLDSAGMFVGGEPPPYSPMGEAVCGDPGWAVKQKAYELAVGPIERRRRRQQIAAGLTGGWPPHIAVMESNALWFRAQRAAIWIEAQERAQRDLITQISDRLFGQGRF